MNARNYYVVVLDWDAAHQQTTYHVALIERCNYAPGWQLVDWFMRDLTHAAAAYIARSVNADRRAEAKQ